MSGIRRKALVTGSSSGIGRAVAKQLARDGCDVWVHYRSRSEAAEAVVEDVRRLGGQATAICFDIGDWEQTQRQLSKLLEAEQRIDVLVHNAGITDDAPLLGMDITQWTRVVNTDLNGFFHVTRLLLMPMIRNRWGRIVSVSSIAAIHGNRGQTNYAAAKAGLIGATRSLAKEVASRGVCVNAIAPGFIDTQMIDSIPEQLIRDVVPMQRAGRAEEVAQVAGFLCSDAASYLTGDVLNVSGGII